MSKPRPPIWADKFLEWFCSDEQIEILQGDLHELYQWRVEEKGRFKANLFFIKDVLDMLRPFAMRKKESSRNLKGYDMFKSNFKISIRSLMKQRTNTLINVSGLSLGIMVCLLIGIYVKHELNYDQFPVEKDRIYRVTSHWADFVPRAKTSLPLGPSLKEDIPMIDESVRFMKVLTNDNSGIPVRYKDKKFAETGFVSVDKAFIDMFSIELVMGDRKTALDDKSKVLISEEIAKKYFGNENPIGEVLRAEERFDIVVSGVFKSVNDESHLHFDFISPITYMSEGKWGPYTFTQNWTTTFSWTYVTLKESASVDAVETLFPDLIKRRYPENFGEKYGGFDLDLQPLADIHLRSNLEQEIQKNGEIRLLIQMLIIALVILLVAAINFINLSTARSVLRAKEVGIRKAMGALRAQLIRQFLTESFLLTTLAFLLALGLVVLFLPQFNTLMEKQFVMDTNLLLDIAVFGVILIIVLALFAGLYPAFVLSGFQPVQVLKSSLISGGKGVGLRKIFITIQFATSLVFLIGLYIIYDQLSFIKTKEVGMDTSQVLIINRPPQSVKNDVIISALEQVPSVDKVTAAAGSLPGNSYATWSYHPEGFPRERKSMYTLWGSNDVASTFKMDVLSGSDFSKVHAKDSMSFMILNESAVKDLGWTNEEAIGKYFGEFHWRQDTITSGKVIGVVRDFHFQSLHEPVKPVVLLYTDNDFGNLIVRLNRFDGAQTITALEQVWNEQLPELPFTVTFLEDTVQAMYETEERLRESINYFSIIAIFTSGMGLLGLVSFVLIQRSKEIGIRKVLGAGLSALIRTLSGDFAKLMLIAFLISAPAGYYLMSQWLSSFAFRVNIGAAPFFFAFGTLLLICSLTVGYKSFRAASVNPVEILRE